MARSRSKYSRAQIRSRVRKPRRRGSSQWFYAAMAGIVVLGVVGIVLSRGSDSAAVPPQPGNPSTGAAGDHWHAAFDVNVCGEWLTPPAEFETAADNPNVRVGIHTHADGFIHTHPFTRSEGGNNATLGRFLEYGGWSVRGDSFDVWQGPSADSTKTSWSNGDTCPPGTTLAGQEGVVKWSVDCKNRTGNPSAIKLRDLEVIAVAFLPKKEPIGVPPNASATPADDGSTPSAFDVEDCTTAGPGGQVATTTPPAATTETTLPPSSSP